MNFVKALLLGAILLLFAVEGMAQKPNEGKNFVGAKILFIDYGTPNSVDDLDITNGFEIFYRRNLNPYLAFSVPIKAGFINVADDMNNRNFFSIDGVVRGQYYQKDARFVPYVFAGVGYVTESDGPSNTQIPLGLGTGIRIGANSYLNIQGEYRVSNEEMRDNLQLGLGLDFRLGKNNFSDSDGDGVSDEEDACPQIAGLKAMQGCPDSDGDGISDLNDKCPNEAGIEASGGCPDKDGDSIADKDDKCPEVSGTAELMGCPDSDGDGVADGDDNCPEVAGLANLQGCPDSDGDGIPDANDDCPEEAGTLANKGCPGPTDSDGDGFNDDDDNCPDVAGPLNGCPDGDKDGVSDKDDECPEEAGPESNKGCPVKNDSDGDGFADEVDQCPEEAGIINGCPDSDNDGVADKDDRCPTKAGASNGCPDSDGDGLDDAEDSCPESAGPVENKGCPEIEEEDKKVLEFAMQAVRFQTGSSRLLTESNEILDKILAIMKRYPDYLLQIAGHTDSVGNPQRNQILSESRAKACYDYLLRKGIEVGRLSFIGYGQTQPIADNNRTAGRQLNRRVEFKMIVP